MGGSPRCRVWTRWPHSLPMEVLKTSSRESAVKAFDILESSREGMELLTHMSENDGTVDIYG